MSTELVVGCSIKKRSKGTVKRLIECLRLATSPHLSLHLPFVTIQYSVGKTTQYFYSHHVLSLTFYCTGFIVSRDPANGGDTTYATYEELELAFKKEDVHPGDLKAAVEGYINKLLEPIRKKFEDPAFKKLIERAYPSPSKQSKLCLLPEYHTLFTKLALFLTYFRRSLC